MCIIIQSEKWYILSALYSQGDLYRLASKVVKQQSIEPRPYRSISDTSLREFTVLYEMLYSVFATSFCLSLGVGALAVQKPPFSVLYTLDNNPNGSAIVAVKATETGELSDPVRIPTGGRGLLGITGQGQPHVGSTFGSGAVVVSDNVSTLEI